MIGALTNAKNNFDLAHEEHGIALTAVNTLKFKKLFDSVF